MVCILIHGIYIWAFLLQQILVYYLGSVFLLPNGYSLLCFLVTLVFAMISWYQIEHPLIRISSALSGSGGRQIDFVKRYIALKTLSYMHF